MCGRYTFRPSWQEIVRLYRLTDTKPPSNLQPQLDIRPTTVVLIVREPERDRREAAIVKWQLVPPWVKKAGRSYSMFNARAETIEEKRSFAGPFQHRHCLIPASGFYEWKDEGRKRKTRYYITTRSGAPITFAGLWDRNHNLDIESCTIIVTERNKLMATIHNRMPVILAETDWDDWLAEPRKDLLRPAPEDDLIAYPVPSDIKDGDPPEKIARA